MSRFQIFRHITKSHVQNIEINSWSRRS